MDLQVNDIVTLNHYSRVRPQLGAVLKIENNLLVIKPSKEFIIFNYFDNDPVVIGYNNDNQVMLLECVIHQIDYRTGFIILKKISQHSFVNQRASERYPTSLYAGLKKADTKFTVLVKNISNSGLCIFSKEDFSKELKSKLEIEMVLLDKVFNLKIEIAWSEKISSGYDYGVKFILEDDGNSALIEEYIRYLKDVQKKSIEELKCSKPGQAGVYYY